VCVCVLESPKNLPRDLIWIMIDQKQPKNVEHFNYVGSMITNYARCIRGIKSKIALAKAASNKRTTLFTNKLELLYSFFWGIPRRLDFMCRRFGTLCLFHPHKWCKQEEIKRNWNEI